MNRTKFIGGEEKKKKKEPTKKKGFFGMSDEKPKGKTKRYNYVLKDYYNGGSYVKRHFVFDALNGKDVKMYKTAQEAKLYTNYHNENGK